MPRARVCRDCGKRYLNEIKCPVRDCGSKNWEYADYRNYRVLVPPTKTPLPGSTEDYGSE